MADHQRPGTGLRPRPIASAYTRPFWTGCREGELRLPRCAGCRSLHYPPPPRCPRCLHNSFQWERLSGRGRIVAWTKVHLPTVPGVTPPFILVEVALEEEATVIVTALLDGSEPPIGGAVAMIPTPPDDRGSVYPQFRLAGGLP